MLKPQVRYLTCADPENFLEGGGGGGGHLQTSVGPAPYQRSRHKSIKNGSIMAQIPTFGTFRGQNKI